MDLMFERPQGGEFTMTLDYARQRLERADLDRMKNAV